MLIIDALFIVIEKKKSFINISFQISLMEVLECFLCTFK